jgi:cell wall-associated NlpC family hydrolase
LTLMDPAPILPGVSTARRPTRSPRPATSAVALLLCAGLAGAPAVAAPGEPPGSNDALLQLLHDKGLLDAAAARTPAAPGAGREAGGGASELVLAALNFLDVPYQRGGNHRHEGFDCSGFTRHVFALSLGLALPRRAEDQAAQSGLLQVSRDELRPGDLVFFDTMRRAFSHVGIYIGDGRFIHAPRPGAEVRVESMRKAYWERRYNGARRPASPL